jgi:glycerophosphoryl diester phosphodiesterase
MPLAYLTEPATVAAAALWWGAAPTGSVPATIAAEAAGAPWQPVWAPQHGSLTPASLAEAHALGLLVVPWTVNDPADMARLIGWGVDGLCSDRPDLLPK